MSISSGAAGESPSRFSTKLPFDVCFPAHLKHLLCGLSEAAQQGQTEQFQHGLRLTLDFLMRFWTGAALGALDRLQGTSVPIPPEPTWLDTLKLLRYAVMAWEGHQQSSFRTLLRLGFFEAGDPPRPRLQCRWLGIAGEWHPDSSPAENPIWEDDRLPLPGSTARYLEVVCEWLRASRPLFVKLNRRYEEKQGLLVVTLEDGRGKQLPLLPAPPWRVYAPHWNLEQVLQAEAASSLQNLPKPVVDENPSTDWLDESLDDMLSAPPGPLRAAQAPEIPAEMPAPAEPPAEPPAKPPEESVDEFSDVPQALLDSDENDPLTPSPDSQSMLEPVQPLPSPESLEMPSLRAKAPPALDLNESLDALLGLDAPKPLTTPRWRPRPLEFPSTLPTGVRRQMEIARRSVLDYSNLKQDEDDAARRNLASGLLQGLACLLELTARVACAGLAQVAPLPEPLRVALRQPVPANQAVKLLHFAWNSLQEYPKQAAFGLLQALFFELNAPDVPRLHARWLGMPDAPMIGLQHVAFWVRLSAGQIQCGPSEFQIQLRELLDALQLWLVAGSPLWAACDPELYIRPDGHWSGAVTLGGERFLLDPDTKQEEPLEILLARWRQVCSGQRPPFFVLDEVLEFVESVAPGSGLMVQGPACVGKSFLLQDLVERQPQVGNYRYGWISVDSHDPFSLEQLNSRLDELHQLGFPWSALGPAALADLQRHSSHENLFEHYFAALQERNQNIHDSVRLVLLEDNVSSPDELVWCNLALPSPFVWVGATEEELPAAWTATCPPARLPIARDDLSYQKLALDFLQQTLEWQRPQLQEFVRRSGDDLLVLRLWVGALDAGLVSHSSDLPEPARAATWVLHQIVEDRGARPVLFLLSVSQHGLPLEQLTEGIWAQSLRTLLQHYAWLVVEKPGGRICLRHPLLVQAVADLQHPERNETIAQFCQYLIVKLNTTGQLNLDQEDLLRWIAHSGAGEAAWSALQSEDFRRWKDQQIHYFDGAGQGHRKVKLVTQWLAVLELALQWCREHSPLQLHTVLEEQLWSTSSRALTYRGLGRLPEALLDVEQAIAGFRPLVDQRPELANGLAAAFNRRSEILREMSRHNQALQDADEAVRIYGDIAAFDAPRWEPLLALALHHRSLLHQEMGRLEEAEADLKRSLGHYQPHRDQLRARMRMDLVQAYLSRASLAARRGDGLLARDDSLRCLELLQRFHEVWTELRVLEAQAQTQLAEAHRLLEDETRALEASNRATELWKELIEEGRLDLRGGYAQELTRRGQLLFDVSQFELAFEAAQTAVDMLSHLVESEGRADLATWLSRALLLRGRIWQRQGRSESARRDLSLAFHYVNQPAGEGDPSNNPAIHVMVQATVLLAQLNLTLGQAEQAVEQLQSCLACVKLGAEESEWENRALLESLLGRMLPAGEEALAAHERALTAYNQLVDEQGHYQLLPRLAEAHLGRARTYRKVGEEEAALADANQAVDLLTFLSEKGGDPEVLRLLPPARFEAAEILGSLGQKSRALEHLEGGLVDLELMESDFGKAEYFLQRARALSLRGQLVEDDRAAEAFSEALEQLDKAGQEGAETQFLESDIRRQRAEVLLRLGKTAEAVDELLGRSGQSGKLEGDSRREQVGNLLQAMLDEARTRAYRDTEALVGAYSRAIQVAELLLQGDASGQVAPVLSRAYFERARAVWDAQSPDRALEDLARAISTASLETPDSEILIDMFELRAGYSLELGYTTAVFADTSRALERLALLPSADSLRRISLHWMRVEAEPEDAGAWGDLQALSRLLADSADVLQRARLKRAQARWLHRFGWAARSGELVAQALHELQRACSQTRGDAHGRLVSEVLDLLMQRFLWDVQPQHLLDWALWLGDQLEHHPDLSQGLQAPIKQVWAWTDTASRHDLERFSQIWLALLAANPHLPDCCFELVPRCAASLRLDDFDSSTWISLMEIMDRRAADESLTRLTWEGKTLDHFLSLPREEVSSNPDLEMALADCLRRWAELPSHRLAMAGVSSEALGAWLEG